MTDDKGHTVVPVKRWGHLGCLGLLGFTVTLDYSVARPPIESLFLEHFGRDGLPWVWLAVAVGSFAVVAFYNRFVGTMPLLRLFSTCIAVSAASLVVLLWLNPYVPRAGAFVLYLWKDIYIVVLVELFWTYANSVFALRTARATYGMFLAVGTVGSFLGNAAAEQLSTTFGSQTAQWFILIPLFVAWAVIWIQRRWFGEGPAGESAITRAPWREGFLRVRQSRFLPLLIALIGVVQIAITLIDYQYQSFLHHKFPDLDQRTGVIARVYQAIDVGTLLLQLLSSSILRFAGVSLTLLLLPLVLLSTVSAAVVSPRFLATAISKVASKAFDYSIFRAAKELLYIPLEHHEKTQGKAIVDVMTYRVAKALASLLLLCALLFDWGYAVDALVFWALIAWFYVTKRLLARYHGTLKV
ncbi:MAG: Npt1/Npt2 family nucleotide transporter [Myxococcota bacterium]